jgi:hypothetical protein
MHLIFGVSDITLFISISDSLRGPSKPGVSINEYCLFSKYNLPIWHFLVHISRPSEVSKIFDLVIVLIKVVFPTPLFPKTKILFSSLLFLIYSKPLAHSII